MPWTDTDRLDFLEKLLGQNRYTGRAVLRWSTNGRGIRLHETSRSKAQKSIREAIDMAHTLGIDFRTSRTIP